MSESTELESAASTQSEAAATDRRRPGRIENVSPELIPMLRNQEPELDIEFEDTDQTSAIRGLFFGVLFSAPLWVGIAYLGSLILKK